jgi:uncharacterized membrane protein
MIARVRHRWQEMLTSFWFVPAMIVVAAVGLAVVLVAAEAWLELRADERWPMVFGAGAEGARGLLEAVAGSMITVAGVVFSITIVTLSLASSQYTSRVLRNFMRDRMNQTVLGVFVGIFAYCLVVLRTIRSEDEGAFVPSLAVMGGLLLALVGIGFLIVFIHHISVSIQASSIIAAAARETIGAVDRLFPDELGEGAEGDPDGDAAIPLPERVWSAVPARETGYIMRVDGDALLALARARGIVVRMERGIGEFVVEGAALASVSGLAGLDDEAVDEVCAAYVVGRDRTVEQDAGFGIRQIVDVALKALSPGINDSTTAVTCVDHLGAILVRLAPRRIPARYRYERGELRVIARGPTFESLLAQAFDEIRQNAEGNVAVLAHLLEVLATIDGRTTNGRRRQALVEQVAWVVETAERSVPSAHDRATIATRCAGFAKPGALGRLRSPQPPAAERP